MNMKNKICFVNCSANGSTGNIVKNLATFCSDTFDCCYILGDNLHGSDHVLSLSNTPLKYKLSRTQTFIFGNDGFLHGSNKYKIRKFLEKEKPDLIHLHNVHRSFCNLEEVFNYSLKHNVKIVWTLHDEWILTGRCCCPQGCKKWIECCNRCEHKNYYPRAIFDRSLKFYQKKRTLLEKIGENVTFVTPSKWLNEEVSCLGKSNLVINNGIDTNIFKPGSANPEIEQFAKNRFVVGGAALFFNDLKGGEIFKELSNKLDPRKFLIVLIGSEKNQIERISDNLIILPKTASLEEMASFYNSLNVFVNPTKTDNYPTTHLESISCGTPVITFNVGGATEMIKDKEAGFSVKYGDVDGIISKIEEIYTNQTLYSREKVAEKSNFSKENFCKEYKQLYLNLLKD